MATPLQDIEIPQRNSRLLRFRVKKKDGSRFDFTGSQAIFMLKADAKDADLLSKIIKLTAGLVFDKYRGSDTQISFSSSKRDVILDQMDVHVLAADTEPALLPSGMYVYQVDVFPPLSADRYTLGRGAVKILTTMILTAPDVQP